MLFLIEYNRLRGEIVSITTYTNEQREQADDARLELEILQRRAGRLQEVVMMEAEDEAALRKTHARFFKSAQALLPTASGVDVAVSG